MNTQLLDQTNDAIEAIDGLLIDTITGEIVGVVAPDGGQLFDTVEKPAMFVVDTEDKANWVLGRILKRDSAIYAATLAQADAETEIEERIADVMARLESTPEMIELRAISANCRRIIDRNQREKDGLLTRFTEELKHFARKALAGAKTRTLNLSFGTIALRKIGGAAKVVDETKFIAYALEENRLSWLKMAPLVSRVGPGFTDLEAAGMAIEPEDDKVTISTGVGK